MPSKHMLSDMPFTALAGYMVVVCTCLAISISVVLSGSNFSPFDYLIEDFGIVAKNPSGAFIYDMGFVFAGLFLCIFSTGFKVWYNGNPWHNSLMIAAQIAGTISGMVLMVEGATLMRGNDQPLVWSISFFLSVGIAISLVCLCMFLRKDENEDTICVGVTSIALIVLLAVTSYLNITPVITEWLAVVSMLAWAAMIARDMGRQTLTIRARKHDQAQTPSTS